MEHLDSLGPMRRPLWLLFSVWALVFLFAGAAIQPILGPLVFNVVYDPHDSSNQQSEEVAAAVPEPSASFIWNRDVPQWLAGLAGLASAFISVWLIRVTRSSVRAAVAAANAARDTADVMISIERGHLIYGGGGRSDFAIQYLFEVQGKQGITLLAIGHHLQLVEEAEDAVAIRDIALDAFEINVRPGQHLGSWSGIDEEFVETPRIPIPLAMWERTTTAEVTMVVTIRLLYRTIFGVYVQSHTFMFAEGHQTFSMWRPDLTHDWRNEEWDRRFANAVENRHQRPSAGG